MPEVVTRVKGVSADGTISFEADLLDDGTLRIDRKSVRKGDLQANLDALGPNLNASPTSQKIIGLPDSPVPSPKPMLPWKHYGSARMIGGKPPYRKVIK